MGGRNLLSRVMNVERTILKMWPKFSAMLVSGWKTHYTSATLINYNSHHAPYTHQFLIPRDYTHTVGSSWRNDNQGFKDCTQTYLLSLQLSVQSGRELELEQKPEPNWNRNLYLYLCLCLCLLHNGICSSYQWFCGIVVLQRSATAEPVTFLRLGDCATHCANVLQPTL